MPRYFLELSYKGTAYSGFQIQDTGNTIQSEITKALQTIFRQPFELTGSSRTDAGVHAKQNYFHFDTNLELSNKNCYALNAVLPKDIAVHRIALVADDAHSRFQAISRSYRYSIHAIKDPFLTETAWLYPFPLQKDTLDQAAAILMEYTDFTSFSKRNTQVNNFNCQLSRSEWIEKDGILVYEVTANRFLRGMIRGLVATMLKTGRGTLTLQGFRNILEALDCSKADFSAPAHGLCLMQVNYPSNILPLS
ncbi:MAG: tRNA pseudouridine(38-40) synthase TruA [Bacteroidetes bacterium 24-39-8]|jgi:tRNA pseudouridine38-40 synthase|nr:MAG: tRNA pseudouridine(38-40) synthase TruA [Sphingobacteriia bacterium 35-40-8]OYZ47217.1 MAG: tRNA pseudouridine(38-40) synthase TruA [Bacteroidetes bacterium 24-39-8]HQR93824.1 tRNA pseudouridine(38-40) synthase TruA [Sediminibacterium sp.]HQS56697.1 tRNA pseudouridine(38-40) synthase TruA [Sediminibacterium sp.]